MIRQQTDIPLDLRIASWLFIVFGMVSLLDMVINLVNGDLSIEFGLLDLFIGIALLRLRAPWRTLGIISAVIAMFAAVLLSILVFIARVPAETNLFKIYPIRMPVALLVTLIVAVFLVSLWQVLILSRKSTRELFEAASVPVVKREG